MFGSPPSPPPPPNTQGSHAKANPATCGEKGFGSKGVKGRSKGHPYNPSPSTEGKGKGHLPPGLIQTEFDRERTIIDASSSDSAPPTPPLSISRDGELAVAPSPSGPPSSSYLSLPSGVPSVSVDPPSTGGEVEAEPTALTIEASASPPTSMEVSNEEAMSTATTGGGIIQELVDEGIYHMEDTSNHARPGPHAHAYFCVPCSTWINGENEAINHYLSKKHIAKCLTL